MKTASIFFVISLLASVGHSAMMDSFKTTGIVKGFDKETVTLTSQGRQMQVPRSAVTEQTLKAGQTVSLTLRWEQVEKFFFPAKSPASVPLK